MEQNTSAVEECHELKNIKYKTMLLNGAPLHETKSSNDMSNLDKFLESEKNYNTNEPWCKLNKTIKTQKLFDFIEIYSQETKLNEEEIHLLTIFLKDCLDKKKLSRVKDVIYDKVTGNIKLIPALTYSKTTKHFTLKNIDKRVSTLKSLAVKKNSGGNGTVRNKDFIQQNLIYDNDSETETNIVI
jgi:hypothetical protein